MFPEGSAAPYERIHRIVDALAGPLKTAPFRISIVGHTARNKASRGTGSANGSSRSTAPTRIGNFCEHGLP